MSWEIGVSTGCFFPFRPTAQALLDVGEAGFSVAEVFLQTTSEYTPLHARRVLRMMVASGVRVHSVHLFTRDLDPLSPYAQRRRDSDALYRQALDLAATIEARVVNYHGATRQQIERGLDEGRLWETLARWHAWAREMELAFTLENVSWCMVPAPEEVRTARDRLPDLRFTFDSFQAAEAGVEPGAMLHAMRDRVATVHLSDFDPSGARHLPLGQGTIRWQSLLHALAGAGYEGPLIIELSHQSEASVRRALAESRTFLDEQIGVAGLRVRGV